MLLSFVLILLLGWLGGVISKQLKLPSLFGMIIVGMLIGPFGLNLIDEMTLALSSVLRQIALIIILSRGGLSLKMNDLVKMGRPALLLSFIPATLEIIGITILSPILLGITWQEGALLGAVLAAVSPAVVVPKMIQIMKMNYGTDKHIPQLVLAGASVDDIFVIVVFYAFLNMVLSGNMNFMSLLVVPLKLIMGIIIGAMLGKLMEIISKLSNINAVHQSMIYLSLSFLIVYFEETLHLPYSGLLAVMTSGIIYKHVIPDQAIKTEHHYNQLWQVAQIALFVLVGMTVDFNIAKQAGIIIVILILGGLLFRTVGTWLALLKTSLNMKERLFVIVSYWPKATVQASIGGIPFAAGVASGQIILVVAVLAILLTVPLGAWCIDHSYQFLLKKSNE